MLAASLESTSMDVFVVHPRSTTTVKVEGESSLGGWNRKCRTKWSTANFAYCCDQPQLFGKKNMSVTFSRTGNDWAMADVAWCSTNKTVWCDDAKHCAPHRSRQTIILTYTDNDTSWSLGVISLPVTGECDRKWRSIEITWHPLVYTVKENPMRATVGRGMSAQDPLVLKILAVTCCHIPSTVEVTNLPETLLSILSWRSSKRARRLRRLPSCQTWRFWCPATCAFASGKLQQWSLCWCSMLLLSSLTMQIFFLCLRCPFCNTWKGEEKHLKRPR